MVKKRIVIPKRYLKIAKQKSTRATRHSQTGRLTGRRALKSGRGDLTKVQYITKTRDWNKSGKIETNEVAGALFGRIKKPVKIRASSKKRGTIRRL